MEQVAVTGRFAVGSACEALGVSRSGFYAHRRKPEGMRRREEATSLRPCIRKVFEESRRSYGSPRVAAALRREGVRCGKNRVARLMRDEGLRARRKRRFRPRTTDSSHGGPFAPNRLGRNNGPPAAPDSVWVSDITYLPTGEGWLYLATVVDLFSRRVVGWETRPSLESELVESALAKAFRQRKPGAGLLVHSDRGVQYAAKTVRRLLAREQAIASMSRPANCYDNAFQESFFSSFKRETGIEVDVPKTRREAELVTFDYIEMFYNPRRLHSSLAYKSPNEHEQQFRSQKTHTNCS